MVNKSGIEFVILRDAWGMRETLVYEEFTEQQFVFQHISPIRFLDVGCHIITATSDILNKLGIIGKDLDEYSLETVQMFLNDALVIQYTF